MNKMTEKNTEDRKRFSPLRWLKRCYEWLCSWFNWLDVRSEVTAALFFSLFAIFIADYAFRNPDLSGHWEVTAAGSYEPNTFNEEMNNFASDTVRVKTLFSTILQGDDPDKQNLAVKQEIDGIKRKAQRSLEAKTNSQDLGKNFFKPVSYLPNTTVYKILLLQDGLSVNGKGDLIRKFKSIDKDFKWKHLSQAWTRFNKAIELNNDQKISTELSGYIDKNFLSPDEAYISLTDTHSAISTDSTMSVFIKFSPDTPKAQKGMDEYNAILEEHKKSGPVTGFYQLKIIDNDTMEGTFQSTDANFSGKTIWKRVLNRESERNTIIEPIITSILGFFENTLSDEDSQSPADQNLTEFNLTKEQAALLRIEYLEELVKAYEKDDRENQKTKKSGTREVGPRYGDVNKELQEARDNLVKLSDGTAELHEESLKPR